MTEILDLPEVRDLVPRLTVAEYHALAESGLLDRRTELIRGIIIRKMSKSPLHSSISKRLYDRILKLAPDDYSVWYGEPLTFIDSEPEPDISVVSGTAEEFDHAHPRSGELVIEVAVTSPSLDRVNAALYAENGVKEYWIVLAKQQAVEVYREPLAGAYRNQITLTGDVIAACERLPQISIPLREIFR